MSGLRLTALPKSIGQLIQIHTLHLENNALTSLPDSIGELRQLRTLKVSNNHLTDLPEALGKLARLQHLDLQRNGLVALPEALGQLTQLTTLNCSYNRLTVLPDSLGKLTKLQSLDLQQNSLVALPEALGQLTQLTTLNCSDNEVTELPESLGKLTRLQRLDLQQNGLAALPGTLGQLMQLTTLNLSANRLVGLPESLAQLLRIKHLTASGNRLGTLPTWLSGLRHLESLCISDASVTSIPDSLGCLERLKNLSLARNELTALPDSIGLLPRLEHLDISSNRISPLPRSLCGLKQLRVLQIGGNPDCDLPPELQNVSPAAMLDYYFSILVSRPLNEAKMILVGRGGVGKTSLVNRLVHDFYDAGESKTDGIAITPWGVQIGKDEVRLNIWDFGGQEIMHATHQFFLTKRSLYLLVLNAREGEQDGNVEYWLRLIQSFGGDSPVLIVINKALAYAFDLNRRGLREKFPAIREFLQTDCESRHGLEELRLAILRETDRLEHLRDPFPASWFSVKDALAHLPEREGKSFIPFVRYQQLCAELGVIKTVSQDTLVGFLHDLGIVVNFRDDPRLAETHVLNPEWMTNGIYKILNADCLTNRQGILQLQDLVSVLEPREYPKAIHIYLLDLMRKFELCYEFYDGDGHYLVPELLGKEEPDLVEFASAPLRFNYRYNILPEGLLPRFIVRSRALNKNLPRWRTGVVLEWEGNRAVVKADLQDRTVAVAVAGDRGGRRRLLSVIRADLEVIHRSISKLEAIEEVPLPGNEGFAADYRELRLLEQDGFTEVPRKVGDKIVKLNVAALLNGVEETSARPPEPTRDTGVRVVFSYSHKDEELRDQLETHLKYLQRQGLISTWHDRRILGGENWAGVIDENFTRADLILLLLSADFIASDYCYEIEMKMAMERERKGEAKVIPVILRACEWKNGPFGKLQGLPRDMKPVTSWTNRDEAFTDIAAGIRKAVEGLHARVKRMGE